MGFGVFAFYSEAIQKTNQKVPFPGDEIIAQQLLILSGDANPAAKKFSDFFQKIFRKFVLYYFLYYLCNKKNKTIMWDLFKILIGIFLLILIIPLLWVLIHVIVLFFGWIFGALSSTGIAIGDVFGWLLIIGLIIFIVWCIFS